MPALPRTRNTAALAALLLAMPLLTPPAALADPPPGVPPAAAAAADAAITAETLEAPIRFLADDLLEGRGPASRGDRLTQLYLASTMQLLGLSPGGPDGSWLQPFDVVGITSAVPETWTFAKGDGSLELAFWDDFIAGSGVQRESSTIDGAELVFVGYGIEAPEHAWDDFKGADLAGKVLVMLNNDPDWDPELFAGDTRLYDGRWTYK